MQYSKILLMAITLFITVALITLSIAAYHSSKEIIDANDSGVKDMSEEWEAADVFELSQHELSGGEVLNSIRRYVNELRIFVNGIGPLPSTFMNTQGEQGYVDPRGVYVCELGMTANGDVESLRFIARSSDNQQPVDLADAIFQLQGAMGKEGASWQEILTAMQEAQKAGTSKRALSNALGLDSNSISWNRLVTSALERMNEGEDRSEQSGTGYEGCYFESGTLNSGQTEVTLQNDPIKSIILYDDNSNTQACLDDVWHFGGRRALNSGNLASIPDGLWAYLEYPVSGGEKKLKRAANITVTYVIVYKND